MKHIYKFLLIFFIGSFLFFSCEKTVKSKIKLSGLWTVKLDSLNVGENEKWYRNILTGSQILLPGTLDENEIGNNNLFKPKMNDTTLFALTRKTEYIGKAWYQKTFKIPKNWKNKKTNLVLERVMWLSKVYINGKYIDLKSSLSVSHQYYIDKDLIEGENVITILVDNSYLHKGISFEHERYPTKASQGFSHAYSNQTQGKWNGIIGEISLQKLEDATVENINIKPDFNANKLKLEVNFFKQQPEGSEFEYSITKNDEVLAKGSIDTYSSIRSEIMTTIDIPKNIEFWDELNTNLYQLNFKTKGSDEEFSTTFGLRNIKAVKNKLTLNGNRIFLRGNLDCAAYPIKGRVDMTEDEWEKTLKLLKSYGFNHIRFHSWTPPKAAFNVGDRLGFYFQVELPHWSLNVGEDKPTNEFLELEMKKILREYGNHPSFVLFSMGNELEGDFSYLNNLIQKAKKIDTNRLYTTSTFSFQKGIGVAPQPQDDFLVTQWTDKGWIRGQGFFNNFPPSFDDNFERQMGHIEVPVISHEIGQYAIFPKFDEIEKYTGVLQPLNLIAIKNDLEKNGLLDLAPEFNYASGKLASILYKEDFERALKTPRFNGFQMLQLQDYPGHGSALIGLLDVFWDNKGIVDSTFFKQFNAPVVPLLNFEKAIYTSDEEFKANVQISNYKKDMTNKTIQWSILDDDKIVENGSFSDKNINVGGLTTVGDFKAKLNVDKPKKLTINVKIYETDYQNNWNIWVYPKMEILNTDVVMTKSFSKAKQLLSEGKKVLLNPDMKNIKGEQNRFGPIFWSRLMFAQPPNMGLLVNPKHSAFQQFPTDVHSDWQWWDLATKSKIVQLPFLKENPIVRVIDDFTTNRNQGIAFEAKVGKGKLLFTSIDLNTDLDKRLSAKQLKNSLLNYMNSDDFDPKDALDYKEIMTLYQK